MVSRLGPFRPLLASGFFLGVGLGGFVDGIVFHQLLQVHSMLSGWIFPDSLVNVEINMFWDGLFHVFCYAMTCAGIVLLWKALRKPGVVPSATVLIGAILCGAGFFNAVEGTIDHQILSVHHVVERAAPAAKLTYDLLFLLSGILMLLIGGMVINTSARNRHA